MGYDIYIGNNRGNKHSRKPRKDHSKDFWDFTFHEMGLYDVPAFVNLINSNNESPKIIYVGHSQGCGQFMALCSLKPEYCQGNFKGMIALGPAVFLDHIRSEFMNVALHSGIEKVFKAFGVNDIMGSPENTNPLTKVICTLNKYFCDYILKQLADKLPTTDDNQSRIKVFFSHFPSGSSVDSLLHLKKINLTKKFIQFKTDDEYPLKNVNIPIYIHVGKDDLLVSTQDGEKFRDNLNPEFVKYYKEHEHMGHLTFFMTNAKDDYVPDVLSNVNEINKLV